MGSLQHTAMSEPSKKMWGNNSEPNLVITTPRMQKNCHVFIFSNDKTKQLMPHCFFSVTWSSTLECQLVWFPFQDLVRGSLVSTSASKQTGCYNGFILEYLLYIQYVVVYACLWLGNKYVLFFILGYGTNMH